MSRFIIAVRNSRIIQRIHIGGNEPLKHLLFVDNVILFSNCAEFEDRKCQEIIKIYCKSTAMDLNVLISIVSFNGINEEIEQHLKAMFPFDYLEMEEGMKYLSFILKPNRYGK